MARFFPPEPLNDFASERAVWDALHALDDDWRVFHSVAWQSERYGRQGDGEADFVLLHPNHGLFVLEVKGGQEIGVEDGAWYTINSRTKQRAPIKNPFEQAKVSKYALLNYLDGIDARLRQIPLGHAVVFPGACHSAGIGPYGSRGLVLDAEDLVDVEAAVTRMVDHWGHRAHVVRADLDTVTRSLAPTTSIKKRLSSTLRAKDAELLELTEQQKQAFHITRTHRRAGVSGGPGTGKTVLAVERARALAADGFRVLLACFNKPLSDELRNAVADTSVTATTFHSLCFAQANMAKLELPEPDSEWWRDGAPEALVAACNITGLSVDAIVIDEGQDFFPGWFDALEMMLSEPDDGIFYVFYDPRQALLQDDWGLPPNLESFPLDWNCRKTLPIARKVCNLFGDPLLSLGTDGISPRWIKATSMDAGVASVQALVDNLLREEGLEPKQIAVLCTSRRAVERLQRLTVSDACFVELGGSGVVAETIYRFKGLETDVAVLLIADGSHSDEELRELSYVGMSRARTMLVVVGNRALQDTLHWNAQNTSASARG